ncbi:MAG: tRNA1(Val) (adenine(37)-N6)-methyltransferase [Bacteroidales bacterium]
MPNNWFQFKKFLVNQDKAAMKVGTDGVLLGAWCSVPYPGSRVLDIGTGTGLIALMVAQRTHEVTIDAIEIDEPSYEQAKGNFQASDWKNRLNAIHSSFQDFSVQSQNRYHLVICNPPFFKNSWKAPSYQRNLARHDDFLNPADLMKFSQRLLEDRGILSIIIPYERLDEILYFADINEMKDFRLAVIRPLPGKPFKRAMLEFSKTDQQKSREEITIEEGERHKYSKRYLELTRDFYL